MSCRDQKPSADPADTRVVPLYGAASLRGASRLDLTGRLDHFPTKAESEVDRSCTTAARACTTLLGAPLDPIGRFAPGGITPTRSGWAAGDREVWCGAESAAPGPVTRDDFLVVFTGKVECVATRLDAVGTLSLVRRRGNPAVPQAAPVRSLRVRRSLRRHRRAAGRADDSGWNRFVGDKCDNVGRVYVGRDLTNDEGVGYLVIPTASWAAGRRTLECTVARYDAKGNPTAYVGSLKA